VFTASDVARISKYAVEDGGGGLSGAIKVLAAAVVGTGLVLVVCRVAHFINSFELVLKFLREIAAILAVGVAVNAIIRALQRITPLLPGWTRVVVGAVIAILFVLQKMLAVFQDLRDDSAAILKASRILDELCTEGGLKLVELRDKGYDQFEIGESDGE